MTQSDFSQADLPRFQDIDPTTIPQTLEKMLNINREKLAKILGQSTFTWENLMQPMDEMGDKLQNYWAPISHMHSVMETESLREAYNKALPMLTQYHTEIMQSSALYKAIATLSEQPTFEKYDAAQQKIIQNDLRDFKLAGIHLSDDKKTKLAELKQLLSREMTKFSENLLDATHAWMLHINDSEQIAGLPEQAIRLARENATTRGLSGYVFTLDFPSYSTALKFIHDRKIRQCLYEAYATRASDQGPHAMQWDNTEVMENILQIRHDIAQIVGFPHYAAYSLATKMAKNTDQVLEFLHDLLKRSKHFAEQESRELADLAKKRDNLDRLEIWDVAYYSELLSESKFKFTQEDLRPYFPINRVLSGLFQIVQKLYGLSIIKQNNIEVWRDDVAFFAVYDAQGELRGGFYTDLYARGGKRDGAWMDECRARQLSPNGHLQYPVAFLTCNFMQPVGNVPALLTHDDVITLFHEFGHCLHHMLSKVNYISLSGINGVPWDAVEFPSQFMENFCYEKETLAILTGHYQTGERLPDDLYEKMLEAKHFQTGLQMVRQIEFALFDFRLHLEWDKNKPKLVQSILNDVRKQAAVIAVPEFNRFQHSFSHIFAGGYAAGYYSYKWAEVLSADAYSKFAENGIFDRHTGQTFMENILEVGGVPDPMDAFISFRGREPKIDALLQQSGIA